MSKETSDSGVGMDNKEMPTLPGVVPRKLPPLSSGCGGESVAGAINQEGESEVLTHPLNRIQKKFFIEKKCSMFF